MACGDPMWQCKYCGKTYYTANRTACDCKDAILQDKFKVMFPPDDFFMKPAPKASDGELIPVSMRVPTTDIGVIVGRFQCSRLHQGYVELFNFVRSRHARVFVFVGSTPVKVSKKDPLPFQARRAMIESAYPEFEVFKVDDMFNVNKWSNALDRQIDLLAGPGQTATLYGSRDCTKYTGKYVLESVPCCTNVSSTQIRKELGLRWQNDEKWREGVIWATQNRFPVCYPTVDMACVDLKANTVWMGRKPTEDLFRFPGGFADIHSDSYESDAFRELNEEFCIDGKSLEYIGSTIADDPRYRSQEDKIKTLFYAVTAWDGTPTPGDDLKGGEVKLFTLEALEEGKDTLVVPTHRILVTMLLNWKAKLMARIKQINKNANK